MKSLLDRGITDALAACKESASPLLSSYKEQAGRCVSCFSAGILLAALLTGGVDSLWAQNTSRPDGSPLMRQLHQAVALADHGDKQGAMNLALQLLEQNPKFVPAIKLKGMLLEEDGHGAEAVAAYEEALKLAPNDADLLLKTGIYKLATGNREEAIQLLQQCIRVLPGDGDAQYYLAQAYHLNGQSDLALKAIRQSVKAEPDNPSVLQKYGELLSTDGNYAEGLRWLLKAQHADATLPGLDYDIGAADYKSMDLAGAVQNLTHAAEVHPNDLNSLELLASAQIKLEHWPEAKEAYTRILAYKPDDVESLLGLGHCQVEMRDYQAGVDTLESALRLDPTRLLAHFYLSRAYAGMGKTADAQHEAALHHLMMEQVSFVRSVESQERESAITAQARQLLSEHREEEALRLYREHFMRTAATDGDAYVFVGKLYLFTGDKEDGLRDLHHALQIEPTVRGAHTYEGILALNSGDLDGAERDFKAELAIDPNYQTAIAEMGEVRYHQGRWSDAAELLAKSRTMTPELLYMLCDSYFHMGNASEADLNAETAAAYARNKPKFIQGLIELLKRNGQIELAGRLSANMKP
jgi:tetratricopeptide (TPR) repeat protein